MTAEKPSDSEKAAYSVLIAVRGAIRATVAPKFPAEPTSKQIIQAGEIIDREAVAPAVRDYDKAMAGLLEILEQKMPDTYWISDSRCMIARHCREQYRHLIEGDWE